MKNDPTHPPDSAERRRDRVILAAAVAALAGRNGALRRIAQVPGHGEGAWAREGRLTVQASHHMPAALVRSAYGQGGWKP